MKLSKKEKVIAAYPHVKASSIHKMVGCTKEYTYHVLKMVGLPLPKYDIYRNKIPKRNRWKEH